MREAIVSALVAGVIGSGIGSVVTYERIQHSQPAYDTYPYPTAVQMPRAKSERETADAAFLDSLKQLHEDAMVAVQIQKATLEILKSGAVR